MPVHTPVTREEHANNLREMTTVQRKVLLNWNYPEELARLRDQASFLQGRIDAFNAHSVTARDCGTTSRGLKF